VLIPRKKPLPDVVKKFGHKLNLVWSGQGGTWMNDEHTAIYLKQLFGGPFGGAGKMIIWDSFACHISEKTKALLHQLGVLSCIIPGGCTKLIQVSLTSKVAHIRYLCLGGGCLLEQGVQVGGAEVL